MICEVYTETPRGLCPTCWSDTVFISGAACGKCGMPLPGQGEDLLCDTCMTFPPVWHQGRAAITYQGSARRMILAFKHGDRLDLAPTMARWIQRSATDLLVRADIIAPVPLHRLRLLKRKYNQSAELSRILAQLSNTKSIPDLLLRTRHTRSQDGLTMAERRENQQGAFVVSPRFITEIQGKSVLLVDDVMTTGATLSACAEVCLASGAKNVDVCVLARVERDG